MPSTTAPHLCAGSGRAVAASYTAPRRPRGGWRAGPRLPPPPPAGPPRSHHRTRRTPPLHRARQGEGGVRLDVEGSHDEGGKGVLEARVAARRRHAMWCWSGCFSCCCGLAGTYRKARPWWWVWVAVAGVEACPGETRPAPMAPAPVTVTASQPVCV